MESCAWISVGFYYWMKNGIFLCTFMLKSHDCWIFPLRVPRTRNYSIFTTYCMHHVDLVSRAGTIKLQMVSQLPPATDFTYPISAVTFLLTRSGQFFLSLIALRPSRPWKDYALIGDRDTIVCILTHVSSLQPYRFERITSARFIGSLSDNICYSHSLRRYYIRRKVSGHYCSVTFTRSAL